MLASLFVPLFHWQSVFKNVFDYAVVLLAFAILGSTAQVEPILIGHRPRMPRQRNGRFTLAKFASETVASLAPPPHLPWLPWPSWPPWPPWAARHRSYHFYFSHLVKQVREVILRSHIAEVFA